MTNRDNGDPGWVFHDLYESSWEAHPDGSLELRFRATPEHGDRILAALDAVAAELPRAAETTDEQHYADVFTEMCKRRIAEIDRLNEPIRARRATAAQMIRDADGANVAVRRRVKSRKPWR